MKLFCGWCHGAHLTQHCPNHAVSTEGDERVATDPSILTRDVPDRPLPRRRPLIPGQSATADRITDTAAEARVARDKRIEELEAEVKHLKGLLAGRAPVAASAPRPKPGGKRGRPTVSEQPLSAAERKRRSRQRRKLTPA
jgi:hypothetical protein